VLFDPGCSLCAWLQRWLVEQAQLVPLTFIAAGSADAARLFPELDRAATLQELHVVDDRGAVYVGNAAYLVVLWALEGHRGMSYALADGPFRGAAKRALEALSKYRPRAVEACERDLCRVEP
jgi:predicted DCC family thiol-disulfide oxidoreductase YuxK